MKLQRKAETDRHRQKKMPLIISFLLFVFLAGSLARGDDLKAEVKFEGVIPDFPLIEVAELPQVPDTIELTNLFGDTEATLVININEMKREDDEITAQANISLSLDGIQLLDQFDAKVELKTKGDEFKFELEGEGEGLKGEIRVEGKIEADTVVNPIAKVELTFKQDTLDALDAFSLIALLPQFSPEQLAEILTGLGFESNIAGIHFSVFFDEVDLVVDEDEGRGTMTVTVEIDAGIISVVETLTGEVELATGDIFLAEVHLAGALVDKFELEVKGDLVDGIVMDATAKIELDVSNGALPSGSPSETHPPGVGRDEEEEPVVEETGEEEETPTQPSDEEESAEEVLITVSAPANIDVDEEFAVTIEVKNVADLVGYQFSLRFDSAVLEASKTAEGDFLKKQGDSTFFLAGAIDNAAGIIADISAVRLTDDSVSGKGPLLIVNFVARSEGTSSLELRDSDLVDLSGQSIPHRVINGEVIVSASMPGDINGDNLIDLLDLIAIAQSFGKAAENAKADVNKDGSVDLFDLIFVALQFGRSGNPAAPALAGVEGEAHARMIRHWLIEARALDDGSEAFRRGIAVLEHLLNGILPQQTQLLPNYPNPFNPETWMPYELAAEAEVVISIYGVNGRRVRTLPLGVQSPGRYTSRENAAYWDGRSDTGERVTSGAYFYHLQAGGYSATKKMIILK